MAAILEIKNVSKIYGEGNAKVVALDGINLSVEKGDFVAITGPSGSGKSTLLNVIGGLEKPSSGEILLYGARIDNLDEDGFVDIRRKNLAYVFQQYHLLQFLTAIENVQLPLSFSSNGQSAKKALEIIKKVGLEKRANHKPSELSGGEQQRTAIARALINEPSVILADEPTGNLDQKTGAEIMALFKELNKEGLTFIMVTHNPENAKIANRIVELQDGKIVRAEK